MEESRLVGHTHSMEESRLAGHIVLHAYIPQKGYANKFLKV